MLALHMALLEWLIQGNPLDLWNRGCLDRGILSPQGTCTGPYDCLIIAAANLLPKEQSRLSPCSPLGALPVPSVLGTTSVVTPLHSLPLTGAPMDHIAETNPQRAHGDPDLEKGIERPHAFRPSGPHQQKISSFAVVLQKITTKSLNRGQTRPIYTRQDEQIAKPIHNQRPLA